MRAKKLNLLPFMPYFVYILIQHTQENRIASFRSALEATELSPSINYPFIGSSTPANDP